MKSFYKSLTITTTLFFLFLFAFLFVNLNQIKPAYAAVACSTSVSSVQAGNNINVTHGGFAAGEDFVVFGIASQTLAPQKTQDSQSALVTESITVPTGTLPGDYNVIIRTRFPITLTTCTGGPFTVTAAVGSTPSCTYTGSTTPNSGDAFSVTYQGFAAGETIGVYDRLGGTLAQNVGLTLDSLTSPQTASSNFSVGAGGYSVMVQTRFPITNTKCADIDVGGGAACAAADVNGDGDIDLADMNAIAFAFGSTPGSPNWNPAYDLNHDDIINQGDVDFANTCDTTIPTTGGTSCSGFFGCLTGILSPTTAFTETGLIGDIFTKILPIAIGLGGFLSVIIIVISGIQFITSNGNPEAAAAARGRLIFAVIGFALLILAFAITQIVDNVFLRGSGVV